MSGYTPRFQAGDRVLVTGPFISSSDAPKKPREAEVTQVDFNDPVWSYQVRVTWRNKERVTWVQERNAQPAAPPIVVPRFTSQAEADAWLAKHS